MVASDCSRTHRLVLVSLIDDVECLNGYGESKREQLMLPHTPSCEAGQEKLE